MITVIGLGNNVNQITDEGKLAISSCSKIIVKTSISQTYSYFENIEHKTLDEFFDSEYDFDTVNQKCADYLLSLKGKVAYCTDGDGVSDGIVKCLIEKGADLKFIYGVSSVSELKAKAGAHLSYTHYTATELIQKNHVEFDRACPVFITEIDDEFLASDLKLLLLDKLGDETVLFYHKKWIEIPVTELDRQRYDHKTSCIIPTAELTKKERFGLADLVEIMKILRSPTGCPWDREQTHQSIRKNLIEEAYELDDAIYRDDIDMMTEECGDVLLQAVFNALIGEEDGEFTLSDTLSMLCLKLINRHTHIFGDVKASNSAEALIAWENAKKKEKAGKGIFDTVPPALPALIRAQKVLKCARVPKTEIQNPKGAEAWGDELFEAVCKMRSEGVDGEEALSDAIARFMKKEVENRD